MGCGEGGVGVGGDRMGAWWGGAWWGGVGWGEGSPKCPPHRLPSPVPFVLLFPVLQITGGCPEKCREAGHCTFLVPEWATALGPEDTRDVPVFLGEKAQVKPGLTRPSEPSV